jgi:hypothetical protein
MRGIVEGKRLKFESLQNKTTITSLRTQCGESLGDKAFVFLSLVLGTELVCNVCMYIYMDEDL